jgi:hypothetical protein
MAARRDSAANGFVCRPPAQVCLILRPDDSFLNGNGPRSMTLSGSIVSDRTRRLAALVVLAVMPVVFMYGKERLAEARGPLWLGSNSDPSYAYLFNALQLAETGTVFHVDHPGTTAQAAGALLLLWSRVGKSTESWIQSVLEQSEDHLEMIVALANAATAGVLFFGGWFLYQRLDDLGLALLAQGPSVIFSLSHGYTATWFAPELFFPAIGFALSCVCFVALREGGQSRWLAWWAGVLSGLGLFNKMTFLPYMALGALCFSRRSMVIFLAGFTSTLLLWLCAVWGQMNYFIGWVANLALHSGKWGEGSTGVLDPSCYPRDLANLLTSDPLYLPFLILGVLLPAMWFFRKRSGAGMEALEFRTLFGLTLMDIFSFLLVAKHSAPHYLVPMVSLAPLGVLLISSGLQSLSGGRLRPAWLALLLLPGLAASIPGFRHEVRRLEVRHAEETALQQAAVSLARSASEGPAPLAFFYRGSSPEYALFFGNVYAGLRYASTLSRLYPQALFLDPWAKAYAVFSGPIAPEALYRVNSDVVLVGSENLLPDGGDFPVPPGGRLREVLRTGAGGVYHVERE